MNESLIDYGIKNAVLPRIVTISIVVLACTRTISHTNCMRHTTIKRLSNTLPV